MALCLGSTNYDTSGGSLGDVNLAASYKHGATSVSAAINGLKGDNIALTASHKVDDSLDVAGTFSTHDSKFAVGAGYKIDGDSLVRVNANSDGVVNVGYDRKISDSTSLNAGLQLDANDTGSRKGAHAERHLFSRNSDHRRHPRSRAQFAVLSAPLIRLLSIKWPVNNSRVALIKN